MLCKASMRSLTTSITIWLCISYILIHPLHSNSQALLSTITTQNEMKMKEQDVLNEEIKEKEKNGRLLIGNGEGNTSSSNNSSNNTSDDGFDIAQIVSGDVHNCIRYVNGKVQCWGSNAMSQLGLSTTSDGEIPKNTTIVNLGKGRKASQLFAGGEFNCVIFQDGKVKCWGSNTKGQTGLDPYISSDEYGVVFNSTIIGDVAEEMGDNLKYLNIGSGLFVKTMALGWESTCLLLSNNKILCFGYNGNGVLGQGITSIRRYLSESSNATVNVGTTLELTSIEAHPIGFHVCAMFQGGKAKCWGSGKYGQLGFASGGSVGLSQSDMGEKLPFVDVGTEKTIVKLRVGGDHTCAILSDNKLRCWGLNSSGQLGIGSSKNIGENPGELGNSLAIASLGTSMIPNSMTLLKESTCALLDGSVVKCFGANDEGQLGQGDLISRGNENNSTGDNLPAVKLGTDLAITSMSSGSHHICVHFGKRLVKCFGSNYWYESGVNASGRVGETVEQMGSNLKFIEIPVPLIPATLAPTSSPTVHVDNYNSKRDCYFVNGQVECEAETQSRCGICSYFPDKVKTGVKVKVQYSFEERGRRFRDYEYDTRDSNARRSLFRDALKTLIKKEIKISNAETGLVILLDGSIVEDADGLSGYVVYEISFIQDASKKDAVVAYFNNNPSSKNYIDDLNSAIKQLTGQSDGMFFFPGTISFVPSSITSIPTSKGVCGCQDKDLASKGTKPTITGLTVLTIINMILIINNIFA